MFVKGFCTYIGQGLMGPHETEDNFIKDLVVRLKLLEGNELGGIGMTVTGYDNETGHCVVMFSRPIMEVTAQTILHKDDLFIFE